MAEPDTIPVSAFIASVGKSIRYIGRHCYAFSGKYSATTSDQIVLSFTTGAGYIFGVVQFNGFIDDDTPGGARAAGNCTINFNGQMVVLMTVGDSSVDAPYSERTELIIPPQTKVEVILDAEETAADKWSTVTLAGRVYGDV